MHENAKLDEARYFYTRMCQEAGNKLPFCYNLSAFLSAARSVLQYALEEAMCGNKQCWYDQHMKKCKTLTFFKDRRDFNIHAAPVEVLQRVCAEVQFSWSVLLSESVQVHGSTSPDSSEETEKQALPSRPTPQPVQYSFQEWSGHEDVLTLCTTYLQELEEIVDEGIRLGILTA